MNQQENNRSRLRILAVDDEADARHLLQLVLGGEGWLVEDAASGEQALARLRESAPDLVVLDQLMPRLTGLEVARLIANRGYSLPVIVFSAYADELVAECEAIGAIPIDKLNWPALVAACRQAERGELPPLKTDTPVATTGR
jgi:two-component system response regulator (stage 0 sporulation protein F)